MGSGMQGPVSFCLLIIGCALLAFSVFDRRNGTTPEPELTVVQGVPYNVEWSEVTGRGGSRTRFLHFNVGEHRTTYSQSDPKFDDVAAAITSGHPVRAWVSTRQETIFPRQGWVPLYQLSLGQWQVLAYADTIARRAEQSKSILTMAMVLLVSGAIGVNHWWRNRGPASGYDDA
jgi:hypothetical protein